MVLHNWALECVTTLLWANQRLEQHQYNVNLLAPALHSNENCPLTLKLFVFAYNLEYEKCCSGFHYSENV